MTTHLESQSGETQSGGGMERRNPIRGRDAALSGVEAKETHTGSNPVLTTQCWLQGPIREVHLNKTRTGKTPNLQITAKYQRTV